MSLFWRVVTINGAILLAAALVLVFSPATVSASAATAEVAVLAAGLGGMRERAMLIGGRLAVKRLRPYGTEVVLELPVDRRS